MQPFKTFQRTILCYKYFIYRLQNISALTRKKGCFFKKYIIFSTNDMDQQGKC